MAHKNRNLPRPTPQLYAPPAVYQRQVSPLVISHTLMQATSPQVYIPPNLPDLRLFYPSGPPYDHQTYEGTSFWSRSTSYYKRPPFMLYSRDPRIIPGVSRVSNKNSPSESVDAVEHYCEVCKVSCVGKQSYTAHLAGQKHKKKSKQQEQQQMTDGTVHETEGSIVCFCNICQVACHSRMVFDDYIVGYKRQHNTQLLINNEKTKYPCKFLGIVCIRKVSNDARFWGSKHKKNVSASATKRLGCVVCGVECNSRVSYEEHITSQKHRRNTQQQCADRSHVCKLCRIDCKTKAAFDSHAPEETGGKTKELQCPLCNIKCSGTDTYRAHLSGKQHQRAVKLQTARGSAVPDCETVLAGADQKKWIFSPHVNLENCIEEVLVGKVVHFRCRLCDCTFSDVKAKNVHANGKKHQTALRRFKAASSLPFSSVSHSALPAQNDKASSGNSDSTASPQPVSPHGLPPTSSTCSISPSPIPSTSYFGGRSHVPPMGSTLARPPGPCVAPPGLQTPVSLPPHVLADERYMQTKLRRIAPSEEENATVADNGDFYGCSMDYVMAG
ncbi:Zinc finger RNA-binding protein [Echinococcus granulosus]|uniref:Zinc finger RNA-binding protein n=1 Tax=Echinococcus granulosus TaxID=6210 RepID=W6UNV7_ECHGR|nr:Zinc finger RNA-binding protein [Echinococcus granulosus]EUB55069.1 Zinc finger RNA-binding protein [Echinococcus granulosus]